MGPQWRIPSLVRGGGVVTARGRGRWWEPSGLRGDSWGDSPFGRLLDARRPWPTTYTDSSPEMPDRNRGPESPTRPRTFMEWCALACRPAVVRRGLKFAAVVGAVLIAINHGDAILAGRLERANYLKMALTVVVPYVVSVLSSVSTLADHARQAGAGGEHPTEAA